MKTKKLKSKLTLSKEKISNLSEVKGGGIFITKKECETLAIDCQPSVYFVCITQDNAC